MHVCGMNLSRPGLCALAGAASSDASDKQGLCDAARHLGVGKLRQNAGVELWRRHHVRIKHHHQLPPTECPLMSYPFHVTVRSMYRHTHHAQRDVNDHRDSSAELGAACVALRDWTLAACAEVSCTMPALKLSAYQPLR